MKRLLTATASAMMCGALLHAADFTGLIPMPKKVTPAQGELTLPQGFTVSAPELLAADAADFVSVINHTTGLNVSTTANGNGFVTVTADASLPAEGYTLTIKADGIDIAASTPAGAFYAFQTIKKLLPANVMAGKPGQAETVYTLPLGTVADEPRFEYRGFMLDVSRHFFDADQVKKMLDIMAVYKLNRFHWHLTDDQGWRLPVDKYPLLTTTGATNKNILLTDFDQQKQWRAGEGVIYGPYAYTKEEIRDIVAYAKARHIEVIPEIDMPGHMVAAIHAYPEFSTDPNNERNVHADMNHEIWNGGGVSRDVLDVSNPAVMTFVKDVVDALAELFPYEQIHIGGDECPTLAWEKSPNCQAFMKEHNLANERAIQSWFVKQIADYAREKHGKKISGWNEIITESGVDMEMIREIDPTVYCWIGGEAKAEQNGLKHVYTPFNGGYYINRSYANIDKVGAVRDGALSVTINVNPPLNSNCIGVQGTFWTEQVDRNTDLEYLALPRLIGIAEQGWSSIVTKDLDEFIERVLGDVEYLEMAGYNYGAHQLVIPERRLPDPEKWYRIQSLCTDERSGRVWEVSNNPSTKRLYSRAVKEDNERQLFKFVEDPANAGQYAIVCKGYPDGSLKSVSSGDGSVTDRWDYIVDGDLDYGFVLDKGYYGEVGTNGFYYAIRSAATPGQFMNFAKSGQSYYINVYTNPNDGKGGQMSFVEVAEVGGEDPDPIVSTEFKPNTYYRLHTRFNGDQSQPRYGSVIELLQDDADKGNNAQADRLWSNAPAEKGAGNFDYQWFSFEPDPAGSGYYALVCKAKPEGSVNSTPSVTNAGTTARWDYDNAAKHYGFQLVDTYNGTSVQGVDEEGFYSALTSKDAASGWYINTSAAPQGYSIHLYSNPTDQNAGIYTFEPEASGITAIEANKNGTTAIYDLQGRRLSAPVRGINIVNGKKIVVR